MKIWRNWRKIVMKKGTHGRTRWRTQARRRKDSMEEEPRRTTKKKALGKSSFGESISMFEINPPKQISNKKPREKTSSNNLEKKKHHQTTNSSTNPKKKNIIKQWKFIKPKTQRRKTFAWSFAVVASVTPGLGRSGFMYVFLIWVFWFFVLVFVYDLLFLRVSSDLLVIPSCFCSGVLHVSVLVF